MASTDGRRCTEALKVEPINQPYIMMLWYNDCAPGPNPEDAGLIPASITSSIFLYKYYRYMFIIKCPCGVIGNILRYERRDLRVRILSWVLSSKPLIVDRKSTSNV